MRKFATSDRRPVINASMRVLTLLSALMFALPAFAGATSADASESDAIFTTPSLWQQSANKLDDNELRKIHGKGAAFYVAQPELIPAVILWDESGTKGRSSGTSQVIFKLNVSGATEN